MQRRRKRIFNFWYKNRNRTMFFFLDRSMGGATMKNYFFLRMTISWGAKVVSIWTKPSFVLKCKLPTIVHSSIVGSNCLRSCIDSKFSLIFNKISIRFERIVLKIIFSIRNSFQKIFLISTWDKLELKKRREIFESKRSWIRIQLNPLIGMVDRIQAQVEKPVASTTARNLQVWFIGSYILASV